MKNLKIYDNENQKVILLTSKTKYFKIKDWMRESNEKFQLDSYLVPNALYVF